MSSDKDKWLNFLALTTVLLALGATLSTLSVGKYSNRGILKQTQASNQWAYYQAKSIKGYLYELQKEKLETDLKIMPATTSKEVVTEFEKRIESYGTSIKRYEAEKADIQKQALTLEKERDEASVHSQQFGIAVILLQLAILLSSIASVMKKKPLWILGLFLGAGGFIYLANGLFLFF
jgi:hypothetical protein